MTKEGFGKQYLKEKLCCFHHNDGGKEAGSAENPAIWLLGIQPGDFGERSEEEEKQWEESPNSIKAQRKWPYNRNAFKLFSAMDPKYGTADQWEQFAEDRQVFVPGKRSGYLQGNIYPLNCPDVNNWKSIGKEKTGFETEAEYREWCKQNLFPKIKTWVEEYQPKLIISNGNAYIHHFVKAIFGDEKPEEELVHIHGKKVFYYSQEWQTNKWKRLIVINHLSGGWGNSHEYFDGLGKWIRERLSL